MYMYNWITLHTLETSTATTLLINQLYFNIYKQNETLHCKRNQSNFTPKATRKIRTPGLV